jgi:hypothetical protein
MDCLLSPYGIPPPCWHGFAEDPCGALVPRPRIADTEGRSRLVKMAERRLEDVVMIRVRVCIPGLMLLGVSFETICFHAIGCSPLPPPPRGSHRVSLISPLLPLLSHGNHPVTPYDMEVSRPPEVKAVKGYFSSVQRPHRYNFGRY